MIIMNITNLNHEYPRFRKTFTLICYLSMLLICCCNFNLTSKLHTKDSSQDKDRPIEQKKSIISLIFDKDSIDQFNWEHFIRESDYRLAEAKDFILNTSGVNDSLLGNDIQRALSLPCVALDVNGDGKSDRVCIVVNKKRTDKKRFGLIVFEGATKKDDVVDVYPNLKWVYEEKDLSNSILNYNLRGGGAILSEYSNSKLIKSCYVVWRGSKNTYECSE